MSINKDEIMDLPEGKSSEELDAIMMQDEEGEEEFKADENLAEEALKATEESPAEKLDKGVEEKSKEKTEEKEEELSEEQQQLRAKDSKIASMKHTNRELEIENAKMQGRIEAQKETTTEKVKSPLELAMEAEGVDDPDDLEKPFAVMRKQQAWEKEQEGIKTASDQATKAANAMDTEVKSLQTGDLSPEQAGDGLDFKTVIGLGQSYLDKADLLKIELTRDNQGVAAATRKAYDLCKEAVLAANNSDSKLLQNAINAKSKTVTQKEKTLKTEKDIDDLTTEGDEQGETESKETFSNRLFNFITTE